MSTFFPVPTYGSNFWIIQGTCAAELNRTEELSGGKWKKTKNCMYFLNHRALSDLESPVQSAFPCCLRGEPVGQGVSQVGS